MNQGDAEWLSYGFNASVLDSDPKYAKLVTGESLEHKEWPVSL